MVTKTFICDICKKSVGEADLFGVTVNVSIPKQAQVYSTQLISCKKDICKDCLEKKEIVTLIPKDGAEIANSNQKTFEKSFVEFLEDLGVAFTE